MEKEEDIRGWVDALIAKEKAEIKAEKAKEAKAKRELKRRSTLFIYNK